MILGIDAFNLRAGGGVTHLIEVLRTVEPSVHGFDQVVVWGGAMTLEKIDDRDWLRKVHDPYLDRGLFYRVFWQRFRLRKLVLQAGCSVLFVPGGSDASGFKPIVTMSRNMLPFVWREMMRYGWSLKLLKFLLLRWTQSRSFRKADGVIFLTKYAHDSVMKVIGASRGKNAIIPHGINSRFLTPPRRQRLHTEFSDVSPCRILYVSIIDVYKHQWQVAKAVAQLRIAGVSVVLELIGPPAGGMRCLEETMRCVDPEGAFITYRGAVLYEKLDTFYGNADIGVFASSCENMPNILLEGMAAGLPLACSSMGPMPEVLGDAGTYFDPENSDDIARALFELIDSHDLREHLAQAAFDRAQQYSWEKCADMTFDFLSKISQKQSGINE
ncbi:glycosyltransferase family 4 protein [bacterium]|nr:glycosyltransferase family 4 protein [bacterium]